MKSPRPHVCLACELGLCSTAHVDQMLKANPAATSGGSTLGEEVHDQCIKNRTTVLNGVCLYILNSVIQSLIADSELDLIIKKIIKKSAFSQAKIVIKAYKFNSHHTVWTAAYTIG